MYLKKILRKSSVTWWTLRRSSHTTVITPNVNEAIVEPFHSTMSYRVSDTNSIHLMYDSIGDRVDKLARLRTHDECYHFVRTNTKYTFGELKQRVDELAQNLLNLGFAKGDRLALMLPNVPEMVLAILAAASIGLMIVLVNPAYKLAELEYMLKKTQSKGIIIMENYKTFRHYDLLVRLCPELEVSLKGSIISKNLPDLKHVVVVSPTNKYDFKSATRHNGAWSFGELEKYGLTPSPKPVVDPEDSFALMFTSGTTGIPKAAFGLVTGCLAPIVLANRVVMPSQAMPPNGLELIKAIAGDKCTAIGASPSVYTSILDEPERLNHDLSSLKVALIGASTVSNVLVKQIRDVLGVPNVLVGFGLTESSSAGTITRIVDDQKALDESIGQPIPFTECKVVNKVTGQVVPHNVDGELYMRGFHIMKKYWHEPLRNRDAIDPNGWFKTGDIVSMDNNGYLYFKSRDVEIVKHGGISIYPAEIETFLIQHPAIAGVYVFGYPDDKYGEELCAWIRLKEGISDFGAENILEYCVERIAQFKIPKYVKFVKWFPTNAFGKVHKFKMIDQMLIDLNNLPVDNLFRLK